MKKFNILFFSSGRSDYELIKPIINQFKKKKNFNSYLILTDHIFLKYMDKLIKMLIKRILKNCLRLILIVIL